MWKINLQILNNLYTVRMKRSLMLKHHTLKTSPSVHCKQTAPELFYVAKGLKYGWYHHDDVMQYSMLVLPKPWLSEGVS